MWSKDGMISKQAWATGRSVVREAGILKTDVKYEEIIDMSFVESVRAKLCERFARLRVDSKPNHNWREQNKCQSPSGTNFSPNATRRCSATSGYGARGGFGKRPALLVIDVNYAFCDERPMPILESIKRWRNSCGEDAWVAMPYLKSLIDKATTRASR